MIGLDARFPQVTEHTEESTPLVENKQETLRQENSSDLQQQQLLPKFKEESVPRESSLIDMMNKRKLREETQEFEMGTIVLPMSVNLFFKTFLANEAVFGFEKFCQEDQSFTDVVLGEWVRDEKESSQDGSTKQVLRRNLSMVIPVSGVPFCSSSRCEKE